jgi:hypothetical protein
VSAGILPRRRAERFARLVDEAEGGRRHHVRSDLDRELAPLVDVTRRISTVPLSVAPDPEFRVGLRAMLMARIERDGIGATAVAPVEPPNARRTGPALPPVAGTPRKVRTRAAILVGVAAGAVAISGVSAASDDAMPGDALYAFKRSTERAQLALASSEVSRGQLYLDFAKVRLHEAEQVDPERLHATLVELRADVRQGLRWLAVAALERRDPAPLGAVTSFVEGQRDRLEALVTQVPAEQQKDVLDALNELQQANGRVDGLTAAITCESPGMDEWGPVPGKC